MPEDFNFDDEFPTIILFSIAHIVQLVKTIISENDVLKRLA